LKRGVGCGLWARYEEVWEVLLFLLLLLLLLSANWAWDVEADEDIRRVDGVGAAVGAAVGAGVGECCWRVEGVQGDMSSITVVIIMMGFRR